MTHGVTNYVGVATDEARNNLVTARSESRLSIWLGDGAGDTGEEILHPIASSGTLVTLAWAGDRLVFDSLSNGRPSIASIVPGAPAAVDLIHDAVTAVGTTDGRTIVFSKNQIDAGIWAFDAELQQERRLESGQVWYPVMTPDDRFVVFLSIKSGTQSPWIVPLEGGTPTQIVPAFAGWGSLDVSRDGRRLLFASSPAKNQFMFTTCDLPTCNNRLAVLRGSSRVSATGRLSAMPGLAMARDWPLPGPPRRTTSCCLRDCRHRHSACFASSSGLGSSSCISCGAMSCFRMSD